MTPHESIRLGIDYLSSQQQGNGSFENADRLPSTFLTTLITLCLTELEAAGPLRRGAAHFILRERSPRWTWNYWRRDSDEAHRLPYPDDLDDTFCALAALWHEDKSRIDGEVFARIAEHLIATETASGGPYRTWLVGEDTATWRDVDLAVNANIAYLLSLQDIQLPPLEAYLTAAINGSGPLASPYYVGEAPVIYFLARSYRDSTQEKFRQRAHRLLEECEANNAITTALLLTALLHLGQEPSELAPYVMRLVESQHMDGHWSEAPFCVDPVINGVPHYGGSNALTTAFCVEAFAYYERIAKPAQRVDPVRESTTDLIAASLRGQGVSPTSELGQLYRQQLRHTVEHAPDGQIGAIATITAEAYGYPLSKNVLQELNLASINGWTAYTIYDDIWDNEAKPQLLGAANLAMRRSVAAFRSALSSDRGFQRQIDATFTRMDQANTWELTHARAQIKDDRLVVPELPDYGQLQQLADRSWGHTLAPEGVVRLLALKDQAVQIRQLRQFWHHFLIARQLNDDAHDWEEDLRRGQLSAVVTMILQKDNAKPSRTISLSRDVQALRQCFWDEIIIDVSSLIQAHVDVARAALGRSHMQDPAVFMNWLTSIESAARQAVRERRMVKDFVANFGN